METLIQDLRVSLRRLRKVPGFATIAVLSLSLGIGANTAIFSLVNAALLRPLPIEEPDQLVSFNNVSEKSGRDFPTLSYPNYRDFRDHNDVLSGLIGYRFTPISLSHNGVNERLWGYLATGNYFNVLGIKPALGRLLSQEDDRAPGAHPVTVITYNCWQKRFAGDPHIVGKSIVVNGRNFTIVGVAPQGFRGSEISYVPEMWFPIMMLREIEPGSNWLEQRNFENLFVQGRLKSNISRAQAEASLKTIAAQLAREYPDINEGRTIELSSAGLFGSFMRGPVLGFAGVLMALVAMVLLLACTNMANLLLARAAERRKEIAIRLALGAGRMRLVRQLLTEGVLLSVLGGAFGLLLAYWLIDAIMAFRPPLDVPLSAELHIDHRVLIFTFAVSLVTGLAFGLLPALQTTKTDLVPALKDEVSVGGYRRSWLRNSLVVLQVTLSLVLLICAGLVLRGLQRAHFLNPGFMPQNAIEMSFDLGLQGYDEARGREFQRQLLNRVRAQPGVQFAGIANYVPLSLSISNSSVYIEGQYHGRGGDVPVSRVGSASPGLLQALGIRLLQGRDFTEQDDETKPRVAIINETFARRFWSGDTAVGKRFSLQGPEGPWIEAIGVIQDGKYFSLSEDATPFVYTNLKQNSSNYLNLIVRASSEPQSVISAIRREIGQLDANLPVFNVKTLVEHMKIPLFPARVAAVLLGSFGALALVLAAIGVFGVLSYAVSQRTRDIGIRMALGANPGQIFKIIAGQGLLLTAFGITLGLFLAALGTRLMSNFLYGIDAIDPLTFAGVSFMLLLVAFLAGYFPARKAMKIDPIVALRHD